MAFNRNMAIVPTLTELDGSYPTVRLTLHSEAAALRTLRPHQPSTFENLRNRVTNMFERSRADMEEENSESAFRRNEARLNSIFDGMQDEVNNARTEAIQSMRSLPPQQQDDVVTFWASAKNFFKNIMNWMRNMFRKILEKLRQGWRLIKQAVKDIFATIEGWFSDIF